MEEKYKEPLEYEKVSKLLTKYAIPSIIAMLVSALYNIVDQYLLGKVLVYWAMLLQMSLFH